MPDKDAGLLLTPEEMCDELNRDHKVGQIFFIPNRLRTHLPYYNEIMCLLEAQLAKDRPIIEKPLREQIAELEKELSSYRDWAKSVNEALNSGDGVYRP